MGFSGVQVSSQTAECAGVVTTVYEPPYDYSTPVGHFCHKPGFFNTYIAPEIQPLESSAGSSLLE